MTFDTAAQPAADESITLVYMTSESMTNERVMLSALAPSHELEAAKLRCLDAMGIARDADYTAFETWTRHLCAINGLPWTMPLPLVLVDAMQDSPACMKFLWFMA